MMKKNILVAALLLGCLPLSLNAWEPVGGHIMTKWGKALTPETVWQKYPRPQLQRSQWQNLNGLWQCAVTESDRMAEKVLFDKQILVPFCVESALSGLGMEFKPQDKLWYKRSFTLDPQWKGKRVLLHFGAVDWACEVFVNGKSVGTHLGGNNAFSLDITKAVKIKGENTLMVTVTDPTDTEPVTRGKQQLSPKGIWYTPVSGIWKTVWLEPVAATSIAQVLPQTDIKSSKVNFHFVLEGSKGDEQIEMEVYDGDKKVASYVGGVNGASVVVPDAQLWTPDTPKLYPFKAVLKRGTQTLDKIESYFALREVSKVKDAMGNVRFALNGEALFQYGPLDQGWWPDGLLTPPSEEAMAFDMIQLKKMGFNTIRKHIKVEPELYYYYADSLGLMIWQDMVSGFDLEKANEQHVKAIATEDWDAPAEHEKQWKFEYQEMVNTLRFYPCITTWVLFNEGWGQFRTSLMTDFARSLDDSRIINSVTGWTDRNVGDVLDIHNYPSTAMKFAYECDGRISVLGEFGGLALQVPDHEWSPVNGWGYKNMDASLDLMNNYTRLVYDLESLVSMGLSAAIYTQTTDVEVELNGLMTYDREVVKLNEEMLHLLHSRLYSAQPVSWKHLIERKPEMRIPVIQPKETATYSQTFSFDGKTDHLNLWLSANATVKVCINGNEVFLSAIRQTRNYNHYNISNYLGYLKKGDNVISFEITNELPKKTASFDFALTTY